MEYNWSISLDSQLIMYRVFIEDSTYRMIHYHYRFFWEQHNEWLLIRINLLLVA